MSASRYEIVLSLDAKQDVYTTIVYLERDKSKLAAENWKTRIIAALESLSEMPHRCHRIFEKKIWAEKSAHCFATLTE